jgi:outer membrane lipoprotein SlyB
MKIANKIVLFVVSALAFTSCARQISSDVYSVRQVGEISTTHMGVIKAIREVRIDQSEQLDQNQVGMIGGGAAGGVMGNTIGRGNFFATAGGAIAGAVTGSLLEKKMKQQMALEYVIELNNGELITVVQGLEDTLAIGQPVYVVVSPHGRSRVIPQ